MYIVINKSVCPYHPNTKTKQLQLEAKMYYFYINKIDCMNLLDLVVWETVPVSGLP